VSVTGLNSLCASIIVVDVLLLQEVTVADVAQDVWSIDVMFLVLLTKFLLRDHPLPSNVKYSAFVSKDIRSSRLWSSLAPSLVQVCCSPSTAHVSRPQFLHELVFVSQEKRCTLPDLRAMLSMPWFLDSKPSIRTFCCRDPRVLRQVVIGGEQGIAAVMQAAERLSEGFGTLTPKRLRIPVKTDQYHTRKWRGRPVGPSVANSPPAPRPGSTRASFPSDTAKTSVLDILK
jgi:hypothetical protein